MLEVHVSSVLPVLPVTQRHRVQERIPLGHIFRGNRALLSVAETPSDRGTVRRWLSIVFCKREETRKVRVNFDLTRNGRSLELN